ncbi:MAG TPA: hypothetical protein VF194_05000 [Ferrovibrio sp.]|uniref:hypothetical protein n=1 Tax=Ferrovibrio sp. TaxID=1917215 RepID=UPI002ED4E691
MRRRYLIFERDDLWYVRRQGKTYGGYLTASRALRHAVSLAEKSRSESRSESRSASRGASRGESCVMLLQPSGETRLLWESRDSRTESSAIRRPIVSSRNLPPPSTGNGALSSALHADE